MPGTVLLFPWGTATPCGSGLLWEPERGKPTPHIWFNSKFILINAVSHTDILVQSASPRVFAWLLREPRQGRRQGTLGAGPGKGRGPGNSPRRRGGPRGSQLSAAGRGREAARQPEASRVPAAALRPVCERHLHPGPEASPCGHDAEEAVTRREAGARAPGEPGQGLGRGRAGAGRGGGSFSALEAVSAGPVPATLSHQGCGSRGRESSPMEGFTGPRRS